MTSRHLITAALLLALIVPAAAGPATTLPPAQYDYPFPGTVVENVARDNTVDTANFCKPHPQAATVLGCAFSFTHQTTGERRCYIYIASDARLKKHAAAPETLGDLLMSFGSA